MQEEIYKVQLENVFEGPMDLLVYLIKKNELDIYDIPIALVTEQFLKYLDWMKVMNIDYAGDFIVMASTLAQILQILFGDQGNRNIIYVQLVFFDQIYQKVHRAFKNVFKLDFVNLFLHQDTFNLAISYEL